MNNLKSDWSKFYYYIVFPVLSFLALILVIALIAKDVENKRIEHIEAKEEKQHEITNVDVTEVKGSTTMFLMHFNEGYPIDEQLLTDLTFDYFNPDFLENEFSDQKEKLFGFHGYDKLINSYTSLEGMIKEGGIKSYEIAEIQKDNAKQTITVYVSMDTHVEQNILHWFEWRKIPGEGWKINALSLDGKIESLDPISPKF